jgi:hypothetical protein
MNERIDLLRHDDVGKALTYEGRLYARILDHSSFWRRYGSDEGFRTTRRLISRISAVMERAWRSFIIMGLTS